MVDRLSPRCLKNPLSACRESCVFLRLGVAQQFTEQSQLTVSDIAMLQAMLHAEDMATKGMAVVLFHQQITAPDVIGEFAEQENRKCARRIIEEHCTYI